MHTARLVRLLVTALLVEATIAPAVAGESDLHRERVLEALTEAEGLWRLGRPIEAAAACRGIANHLGLVPLGEFASLAGRARRVIFAIDPSSKDAIERTIASRMGKALEELERAGSPAEQRSLGKAVLQILPLVGAAPVALHRTRGICLYWVGELDPAQRELEKALRLDANDGGSRVALARLLLTRGEVRAAYQNAVCALAQQSTEGTVRILVEILRTVAREGQRSKALEAAIRCCEKIRPPRAAGPVWTLVFELRCEQGDPDGALAALPKVEGDLSAMAPALVKMASDPRHRAKVHASLRTRQPDEFSGAGELLRLAGDLSLEMGEFDRAQAFYEAGLDSCPTDAFVTGLRTIHDRRIRAGELVKAGAIGRRLAGAGHNVEGNQTWLTDDLYDGQTLVEVDQKADEIMEAMSVARRDPTSWPRTLDFAVSAALETAAPVAAAAPVAPVTPVAPGMRTVFPGSARFVRTAPTTGTMLLARYQLLEPFVRQDIPETVRVLQGLLATPQGTFMTPSRTMDEADRKVITRAISSVTKPRTPEKERWVRVLQVAKLPGLRLIEREQPPRTDPLLVDLNGNGQADLTDRSISVQFDLLGWGRPQFIQWVQAGTDGWIAEDTNSDGQIDSGRELFGTAGGYANGWAKLRALRDTDHDGLVHGDELAGLLVWQDQNGNALTDAGEITSVETLGLTEITLPRSGLDSTVTLAGKPVRCWEVLPQIRRIQGDARPDF